MDVTSLAQNRLASGENYHVRGSALICSVVAGITRTMLRNHNLTKKNRTAQW